MPLRSGIRHVQAESDANDLPLPDYQSSLGPVKDDAKKSSKGKSDESFDDFVGGQHTTITAAHSRFSFPVPIGTKPQRRRPVNACAYLGVTPFVLMQLVEIGRVKLTRPEDGSRPYFAKEDLEAYLASRKA